jgi:hypothetical protein
MKKSLLLCSLLVSVCVHAAPPSAPRTSEDASCSSIKKLTRERDAALAKQDFASYCKALEGLIRAMPVTETRPAQLKCEAGEMSVPAWQKVRKDVLASTSATYQQQCKR